MTATATAPVDRAETEASKLPSLEVEDLQVVFRARRRTTEVLRGVTFTVEPGKTFVLLGESGSGKSVTAKAVMRLLAPSTEISGRVALGNIDLSDLPEREMRSHRGRTIGLVPQDASGALDPLRRIGSQVTDVLKAHRVEPNRKAARARAEDLLRQVGIPDPGRVASSFPHQLSGGMRQRALIAIAIACEPKMLIADEPTSALDVTVQAQVLELMVELQQKLGMGLLMVTHDVAVARDAADVVAVMYAGRIVERGTATEVLDDASHPYTSGLLRAVPAPAIPRGHLQAIPGRPPAAADVPQFGCAFAPRCVLATSGCVEATPTLLQLSATHEAACPPATKVHGALELLAPAGEKGA